jgi:pyruvate-formate lyase-activating enzyme
MRLFRWFDADRASVATTTPSIEPAPEASPEGERTPGALVLAGPAPLSYGQLALGSRALLDAACAQARDTLGAGALALILDARRRRAASLASGEAVSEERLRTIGFYCNPSYLLLDAPPPAEMLEAARIHGVAWCGSPAGGDLYAVAFGSRDVARELMWPALRSLAAGVDDAEGVGAWRSAERGTVLLPGASGVERSPSVRGVTQRDVRAGPEAPRYLNTAFSELLQLPNGSAPQELAASLRAWRAASRVPWVANSLLNEVEYQRGEDQPESFPLELHLSLTGVCNLECRFCGYSHDTARFDRVTPDQVDRLDFLPLLRVLRLNAALGEPTANAHLAAIVDRIAERHPHLVLNFFTNGVNLHNHGLIPALVGRVRWMSVSLNASTEESWRDVCQAPFFRRVLANLRELQQAKRAAGNPLPLVYATMVLQGANLEDLPQMPALCREHGIDRFTAFPFSAFTLRVPGRYGPEMSLEACRDRYEAVYEETLREAERHEVSIELPLPAVHKQVSFGLERRGFHDFARVETNDWPLQRLVDRLALPRPERAHCAFLWRQASLASTRLGQSPDESHYLNPCLGPLSRVDLSRRAAFRFGGFDDFQRLWRNSVFTKLREGQRREGVSRVCDACRGTDTRDPSQFARLRVLVDDFARQHTGVDGS